MVNKHNTDAVQADPDITTTDTDTIVTEPELEETEDHLESKIKKLQVKLKEAEAKYQAVHEEMQRTKADFLNARKRLEDERMRDRERVTVAHIEKLLPICDSFFMAMQDKAGWEKADTVWRKGMEGIYAQLQALLTSYHVITSNPHGELFDPNRHEALGNVSTTNADAHNSIAAVVQLGYSIKEHDVETVIRPARVMVAHYDAPTDIK